jgi:hypothetical protein
VLDIKNLERRWLKYKIRSYAPYALGAIVSVSIAVGALSWFLSPPEQTGNKVPHRRAAVELNTSAPQHSQVPAEENQTLLEPSMEFVQAFQNHPEEPETPPFSLPKPAPKAPAAAPSSLPPPKVLQMPELPGSPALAVKTVSKGAEKTSLSINRNESEFDIAELHRRFKETGNANLGLFIARYHYNRGEYAESYNYALKTNGINNKIDESWILFSKSLIKLGKTEQAKKTLQLYIQQTNSENAKGLLDALDKGTFQ